MNKSSIFFAMNIKDIKIHFNSSYIDDYKLLKVGDFDIQIILVSKSLENMQRLKLQSNKDCDLCSFLSGANINSRFELNQKYQIVPVTASIFKSIILAIDTKHHRHKDIEKVKDVLSLARKYENSIVFSDGVYYPDGIKRHFYLSVINKMYFPIIEEVSDQQKLDSIFNDLNGEVLLINNHVRSGIVIQSQNYEWIFHVYLEIEKLLGRSYSLSKYPFINCFAYKKEKQFQLIIYPRVVHKPTQYYDTSTAQIRVVPGVIQMSGIFITDSELSFKNLNIDSIKSVYEQISYSFTNLKEVLKPLKQKILNIESL